MTTRMVDQQKQKTQGGSVIAERAVLIKLSCSGTKLGLRQSGRMSRQIRVQERIKCQCKQTCMNCSVKAVRLGGVNERQLTRNPEPRRIYYVSLYILFDVLY